MLCNCCQICHFYFDFGSVFVLLILARCMFFIALILVSGCHLLSVRLELTVFV